jgi:hypothetical protein
VLLFITEQAYESREISLCVACKLLESKQDRDKLCDLFILDVLDGVSESREGQDFFFLVLFAV